MRLPVEFVGEVSRNVTSTSEALARLGDLSRKQPLKLEEVDEVGETLQLFISRGQYSVDVQRALLRLRDFHKIRALGGNEKMASDVLVASLAQLRKNVE